MKKSLKISGTGLAIVIVLYFLALFIESAFLGGSSEGFCPYSCKGFRIPITDTCIGKMIDGADCGPELTKEEELKLKKRQLRN